MITALILYLAALVGLLILFLDQFLFINRVYGVKNWLLEEIHYLISKIYKHLKL